MVYNGTRVKMPKQTEKAKENKEKPKTKKK